MPVGQAPAALPAFSIHRLPASSTPSPLVQVTAGSVQGLVPESWQAEPMPVARYPLQGFIASPSLGDWERAAGTVRGMEAFWIDVGKVGLPSDYYYLAARSDLLAPLLSSRTCRKESRKVLLNHPPDLTGRRFSPSDYVASASGTCVKGGEPMRWAYIVAAPGFGPVRQVGIPNSGLYVVAVVVSGAKSRALLHQMVDSARFGDTSVSELLQAASVR